MRTPPSLRRSAGVAAGLLSAGVIVAGCGSSSSSSVAAVRHASATAPAATTNAADSPATVPSSMPGMKMSGSGKAVDGITPIPTQALGKADWQNMDIQAMAMTAVPFVIYNGTREKEVKPTKHTSFHLMVDLTDARSHFQIPYASVWATIRKNGKVVFDERQWPMISEYMGSHYGNNVTLPGAGHYQLSLLVSPPVSARHVEYKHVWLKPHRVNFSFNWKPGA